MARVTHVMANGCETKRCREFRIELDSATGKAQPFIEPRPAVLVEPRQAAQIAVVGIEVLSRMMPSPFDLRLLEAPSDGGNDTSRNSVLQVEDVFQGPVEVISPKMRAAMAVDQLPGDAQAIADLAHAALQHVAHTELAAHLLDVERIALVGKRAGARDHEQ